VAIVGAGGLGLLAVAATRRQGAPAVAIEARHERQKEEAERLGSTIGANGDYDVVIEAAGTVPALRRCAEPVAPGGKVVVLGVHTGQTLPVPWGPLFHREAQLIPSLGYCAHASGSEMADAAAMLAEQPEVVDTIITHRFPLEDAPEAFAVASNRASGAIRVVLES
jgi:threonine dehydrogenase-like Zn-dependent dehydrogenase